PAPLRVSPRRKMQGCGGPSPMMLQAPADIGWMAVIAERDRPRLEVQRAVAEPEPGRPAGPNTQPLAGKDGAGEIVADRECTVKRQLGRSRRRKRRASV